MGSTLCICVGSGPCICIPSRILKQARSADDTIFMSGAKEIRQIQLGDYPGTSKAHLAIARHYSSPLLLGPPLCEELLALVEHMFDEEEADLVQHIKPFRPRTATGLASAAGRPLAEVEKIMQRLAHEKYVLLSIDIKDVEWFSLLPIIPGTFEWVLVRKDPESITPWHRGFAQLFEALYATGFTVEYLARPFNIIRYLPVGEAVQAMPAALPASHLEAVLDRYDRFAVGVCQCRLSKQLIGEGCGRMLETCTLMGSWVPAIVAKGRMREVSKNDVLQIKAAAEKEGLITWTMNEDSGKFTSTSCSCCGCCCGALTSITRFNTPGYIAPPRYRPRINRDVCKYCQKCSSVCPMAAIVCEEQGETKRLVYKAERCIGCGLCSLACKNGALTLEEAQGYQEATTRILAYFAQSLRTFTLNSFKVRRRRRRYT